MGDDVRTEQPVQEEAFSAEDEALLAEISDFFTVFAKTVRAAQLYVQGNPILHRFMTDLRGRLSELWDRMPSVNLLIFENEIRWQGKPVYTEKVENKENLAFQLYKDGIRRLELHPGAEGEELQQFLDVLRLARQSQEEEEDLLTLIWYRDFSHIRYEYVDVLGDDPPLPEIRTEVEAGTQLPALPEMELSPELETTDLGEDFEPALYFLGDHEISQLRDELKREWDRPVKRDVTAAFLDQFEMGDQDRRYEIVNVIRQMLPQVLADGDFSHVTWILQELMGIAEKRAEPAVQTHVDEILGELSRPVAVEQLIRILEDGSIRLETEALTSLLNALRPEAIVVLLRSLTSISREEARRQLIATLERLVSSTPTLIKDLLASEDSVVAGEAAKIAGRLKLDAAADGIANLLKRTDSAVRVAAVEALGSLESSTAGQPLIDALEDEERDVRVGAAKALALLKHRPATEELERHIKDSDLWKGDLSEQRAFFEAYGLAAGEDATRLLSRILNGRRFLWVRYPAQARACAARALGLVAGAEASQALADGEGDNDPLVRSAVLAARQGRGKEESDGGR